MSTSLRRPRLVAVALLLLSLLGWPAWAGAQEADAFFSGFEPEGSLQPRVDGQDLAGAKVYLSQKAGAYLVTTEDQVLLVNARSRQIEKIGTDKYRVNEDGTADLLFDATFDTVGKFTIDGQRIFSTLTTGELFEMTPKPSLLGSRTAAEMVEHNPSYGFKAEKYPPSDDVLAELKKETRDVQVLVFFGSWCPTCSRMVPWIMKVEEGLEGSAIQFEYYGLPKEMNDPKSTALDVHGVPTMVVLVDGKEAGRRGAEGLGVPEKAIAEILAGK